MLAVKEIPVFCTSVPNFIGNPHGKNPKNSPPLRLQLLVVSPLLGLVGLLSPPRNRNRVGQWENGGV